LCENKLLLKTYFNNNFFYIGKSQGIILIIQLAVFLKPVYRTGEKIEVILSNERKEFRRKKIEESSSNNYLDEIEAPHSTTVASLKNWLIKKYVCIDTLTRIILDDYKSKINPEINV